MSFGKMINAFRRVRGTPPRTSRHIGRRTPGCGCGSRSDSPGEYEEAKRRFPRTRFAESFRRARFLLDIHVHKRTFGFRFYFFFFFICLNGFPHPSDFYARREVDRCIYRRHLIHAVQIQVVSRFYIRGSVLRYRNRTDVRNNDFLSFSS